MEAPIRRTTVTAMSMLVGVLAVNCRGEPAPSDSPRATTSQLATDDTDASPSRPSATAAAVVASSDDFGQVADADGVRNVLPPASRYTTSEGFPLGDKPSPAPTPPSVVRVADNEYLRAYAAALSAATRITVSIVLDDLKTDWHPVAHAVDDASRTAAIATRAALVENSQSAMKAFVASIGGKHVASHWLANSFLAEVPAGAIPQLLANPAIRDLSLPSARVYKPGGRWEGDAVRTELRTGNLHAAGIKGNRGSTVPGRNRPDGRIKIAIVEPYDAPGRNFPPTSHFGWQKGSILDSRIKTKKKCDFAGCINHTAPNVSGGHGTRVAELAAGSIELGQDPLFSGTNTVAQKKRSGAAPLAYMRYYLANTGQLPDLIRGIEQAVADGVDVINMSWDSTGPCNPTGDPSGFNEVLVNAANAGVMLVAGAGNTSRSTFPGCQLSDPAVRPEVIAVGQLDSKTIINPVTLVHYPQPYSNLAIKDTSSMGGVQIMTHYSTTGFMAGVGLIGPGCFDSLYDSPSGWHGYSMTGCGTSYSSPIVAGMLGLLRQAFWSVGWPRNNARLMMANALLMGDSWDGTTVRTGSTPPDWVTGAGRPRIHWPSNSDLVYPWGWQQRSFAIYPGQTITFPVAGGAPMPAAVTQWKWAAAYTWNDPSAGPGGLQNVPDVDFYVDNVCTGVTNLYSDIGYDVRAVFRLNQAQLAGKCLRMRAYAFSVPPSGVTIHMADYYHSGDPSVH